VNSFRGANSSVGEQESSNQTEHRVGHGHGPVDGEVVVDVDRRVFRRIVDRVAAI
jgi:hypothetical protein